MNHHRIYCVMDMPLSLIEHVLLAIKHSSAAQFINRVTPLALECLQAISLMPENKQQQVIAGELPLYQVASKII